MTLSVDAQAMADVKKNVERLVVLKEEIDSLNAVLKQRADEFRKISEEDIPSSMDAAGCKSFTDSKGYVITVEDFVQASIPKNRQLEAFAWLDNNGYGDLIKVELKANFGRGEREKAIAIAKEVVERFHVGMETKDSVHASTLKAFVKEQLSEGKELPADLLGIYQGRVAKIK